MVIADIERRMRSGRGPKTLSWILEILEIRGVSRQDLQTRTTTRYHKVEYSVPLLLPLLSSHIESLSRGLRCPNVVTTSIELVGYFGDGRHFTAVLDDEQASLLADGIEGNRSLQAIDLSCNR